MLPPREPICPAVLNQILARTVFRLNQRSRTTLSYSGPCKWISAWCCVDPLRPPRLPVKCRSQSAQPCSQRSSPSLNILPLLLHCSDQSRFRIIEDINQFCCLFSGANKIGLATAAHTSGNHWRALQDTLRQVQEIRTYYDFPDIDIDRYVNPLTGFIVMP